MLCCEMCVVMVRGRSLKRSVKFLFTVYIPKSQSSVIVRCDLVILYILYIHAYNINGITDSETTERSATLANASLYNNIFLVVVIVLS